jgi:hypothetical protein
MILASRSMVSRPAKPPDYGGRWESEYNAFIGPQNNRIHGGIMMG